MSSHSVPIRKTSNGDLRSCVRAPLQGGLRRMLTTAPTVAVLLLILGGLLTRLLYFSPRMVSAGVSVASPHKLAVTSLDVMRP